MTAVSLAQILFAVVLGTAAQILFKAGTNATPVGWGLLLEWRVLAGIAAYGISLIAWILALSKTPVSMAYPMTSLGFVLNAVLAGWLLGEAVTPMRFAGIGIIILGVVIVARS